MPSLKQSNNLNHTHYELRGKISAMAAQMEAQNKKILKLHLGNPGLFGMDCPPELLNAISKNLPHSQGYCDSKGLLSAREAIHHKLISQQVINSHPDKIFIGNGVSELINISLAALLNPEDEVLLPRPVYPLWSAATTLNGAKVRYYDCCEDNAWLPNIDTIKQQISPKTKAIVIINPNNPTGSVYPEKTIMDIVKIAEAHQITLFSDEIYADIVYQETPFKTAASLTKNTLMITFGGLSKNYLLAGFRCAWMSISGQVSHAKDYINGIEKLLAMRLCANVPVQHAIPLALSDNRFNMLQQHPDMLEKRNQVIKRINQIDGLSCDLPAGAFYAFPKFTLPHLPWENDNEWVLQFLQEHHILLAPGSTFAQPDQRHFRLVLLPKLEELLEACDKLEFFTQTISNQAIA
jgi:alanine-synthesizing transaminase